MFKKSFSTIIDCKARKTCEYIVSSPFNWGVSLGSGRFGNVFALDKKEVLKVIPLGKETCEQCSMTTFADFETEVVITKYASDHDLCPKFIRSVIVDATAKEKEGEKEEKANVHVKVGMFVQERWPFTLEAYVEKFPSEFKKTRKTIAAMVENLIYKCADINIVHKDLKANNIVVKISEIDHEVTELRFIDFGVAELNPQTVHDPEVSRREMLFGEMWTPFILDFRYL